MHHQPTNVLLLCHAVSNHLVQASNGVWPYELCCCRQLPWCASPESCRCVSSRPAPARHLRRTVTGAGSRCAAAQTPPAQSQASGRTSAGSRGCAGMRGRALPTERTSPCQRIPATLHLTCLTPGSAPGMSGRPCAPRAGPQSPPWPSLRQQGATKVAAKCPQANNAGHEQGAEDVTLQGSNTARAPASFNCVSETGEQRHAVRMCGAPCVL